MKVIETEKPKNIGSIIDDQRQEIKKLRENRQELIKMLLLAKQNMMSLARNKNQSVWDACFECSKLIDKTIAESSF